MLLGIFSYPPLLAHKIPWRYFAMKEPIFILTEQRQPNDLDVTDTIIQQVITAWLTKELRK